MNVPESLKSFLVALFLLILPWIVIIIGITINIVNHLGEVWSAWYYVLAIAWFTSGVIFYIALK